ncbi:hypothetical protein [Marininema mesophilum]|uniref:hypothetical protein n=1 Tax=Marininema mesophilum TaxID=1048340 RepID=UPI0015A63A56|nr:hypothetical protein [Marininema mesophilum]
MKAWMIKEISSISIILVQMQACCGLFRVSKSVIPHPCFYGGIPYPTHHRLRS